MVLVICGGSHNLPTPHLGVTHLYIVQLLAIMKIKCQLEIFRLQHIEAVKYMI